jgi:tetratricopeptide (TPR) repeat protein
MERSPNALRVGRALLAFAVAAVVATAAGAAPAKEDAPGDAAERKRVGIDAVVAEKLLEANERLEKDDDAGALAIVDKLAKRRKLGPADLAQIHRFRGYIYANEGKVEQAADELSRSLAQNALDRSAEQATSYTLAQLYTQTGQYDRALALIEAWFAGETAPKADAYYLKAMILVQQEKFADALAPARTAIDMSPAPRESWVQLLAAIHINLRDYPNVAATLERLVVMAPGKKQYWVQLAAVQHHLERDAKAAATLRLADDAELLQDDKELRQLARLLFLREQPYQCAKVIEDGIAAGTVKGDAESYRLVSNCYLAARETDRALDPLAKAAELAPDGDLYVLLGQIHLQRDRYADALGALERGLAKAKPEQRGSVHLLIGVAELGSERFDAAERAFRAAQSDAKVRRAADSYLQFLEEQRARRQAQPLQTASR